MRTTWVILLVFSFSKNTLLVAQESTIKRISEGVIYYNITVQTEKSATTPMEVVDGGTQTVYLKGYMSRFEISNNVGTQATIVDGKSGNVKLLKTIGTHNYLIEMTAADWKDANKKYENVSFEFFDEYKIIAGLNCQKAIAKFSDGLNITVFFTREIVAENREFEIAFKSLLGLAMEYETVFGDKKVVFSVSKISYNIVPTAKFDLPKNGYRILTYAESKQIGLKN